MIVYQIKYDIVIFLTFLFVSQHCFHYIKYLFTMILLLVQYYFCTRLYLSTALCLSLSLFLCLCLFMSLSIYISICVCVYIYLCTYKFMYIGLVGRVFANGPGDLGSIPCRVILKTLKMVLDTSLLST